MSTPLSILKFSVIHLKTSQQTPNSSVKFILLCNSSLCLFLCRTPCFLRILQNFYNPMHLTPAFWGGWFLSSEWMTYLRKGKAGTAENYFSVGCESQKVTIPHLKKEKCCVGTYCIKSVVRTRARLKGFLHMNPSKLKNVNSIKCTSWWH